MKIIQFTDLHLRGDDKLSFGVADTVKLVGDTMKYFNEMPEEDLPEFFVVTGDLADNGNLTAYHKIHEYLTQLPRPVYVLPGNHDNRANMKEILKEMCPVEEEMDPYICYSIDDQPIRAIIVDTMYESKHYGGLDEKVAQWLEKKLAEQPDKPTIVFTHHPPFITGMGKMDEGFDNKERFAEVLNTHKDVKLCCGHMHRPIMAQWKGTPLMTCPPVAMLIDLKLTPEGGDDFFLADPFYAVHHLTEDGINTHFSVIPTGASYDGPYPFAYLDVDIADGTAQE